MLALTSAVLLAALGGSAQALTGIESVEYDAVNHRFLVSNGNNIIQVNGDGEPVAEFGTAPAADYGMEIMGDALYAIVGSSVKAYDLTTGEQVSSIAISGAEFLNGMASDGDHRIWVSDFNAKTIYEIDFSDLAAPSFIQVVDNTVSTPNGICYDQDNDRLVFVNWGSAAKIKAITLDGSYTVTTLATLNGTAGMPSLGNIDGIDNDDYGNYYIATWSPNRITKFNSDFTIDETITVAGLSSPADIAYAEEIDTLAIPNAGNNTVLFVGFSPVSVEMTEENPLAFSCYPNPLTDKSVLMFTLNRGAVTRISIMDTQGRIVDTILEEYFPAATHKVVPGELDLSAGNYLWHITSGDVTFTLPFIK